MSFNYFEFCLLNEFSSFVTSQPVEDVGAGSVRFGSSWCRCISFAVGVTISYFWFYSCCLQLILETNWSEQDQAAGFLSTLSTWMPNSSNHLYKWWSSHRTLSVTRHFGAITALPTCLKQTVSRRIRSSIFLYQIQSNDCCSFFGLPYHGRAVATRTLKFKSLASFAFVLVHELIKQPTSTRSETR